MPSIVMWRLLAAGMLTTQLAFADASAARAQSAIPPDTATDSALAAITRRGRDLEAYDSAAWHATDALFKTPADTTFNGGIPSWYAIRHDSAGWSVAFGRISTSLDTMFILAVASRPDSAAQFGVRLYHPPLADTGYYATVARAAQVASMDFGKFSRPYNVTVLPAPGGEWWAYIYPAATQAGVWPLGGDQRDRVSADGRTILERRRLHRAVVEYRFNQTQGHAAKAGFHSAVLDNIPEDTDVFVVLERLPSVPEYIITDAFIYKIDVDGRIHYIGRRTGKDGVISR